MGLIVWILCLIGIWLSYLVVPHLALLCVGILFVAVPLVSWLWLFLLRKQVYIEFLSPGVTGKGRPIKLSFELGTKRWSPIGKGLVSLRLSNLTSGESIETKFSVHRGAEWTIESRYCGCIECSIKKFLCYELFGVFPVKISGNENKIIVVMPDTFPVDIENSMSVSMSDDCEEYSPSKKGDDKTETFQIREYVPGDSLQQIHWKLSSKLDQLIVRESSLPIDNELMVFLDRTVDSPSPKETDAILEAVASLGQALTEEGMPFTFAWNQDTIQKYPVMNKDKFPEAVAAMLKTRPMIDDISGAELYAKTNQERVTGTVLYFCFNLPSNDFFESQARYFVCGQAESDRAINFNASDMTDKLRTIRWS